MIPCVFSLFLITGSRDSVRTNLIRTVLLCSSQLFYLLQFMFLQLAPSVGKAFFKIEAWRFAGFVRMSGVPSSSRHLCSVLQRESKSSTQKTSSETSYKPSWRSETSYKPSWHTKTSYKPSEGATARRASVVASSQHTNPNERSFGRTDQWATSKELGSLNSGRGNARCSLNYSSTASQAEDSERIISELHREIHDLR